MPAVPVMHETTLRETVERLELALQAGQAGLFDRDLRTDEIIFSAQQYTTFGLEPGSAVTYEIFRQCVHPEDRDRVETVARQSIEQRTDMEVAYRVVRPDGEVRLLASRVRPYYDADGQPARLIGITVDITDRRRTSDMLQLQARVLDNMMEGVSVVLLDTGLISYTNPAEDRMFGYEPGELVGRHFKERTAYSNEENERVVSGVLRQLRDTGEWAGELCNRRRDGSAFYSYARITTVSLNGQQYAVSVRQDTTRRRFEALDELLPALSGVLDIREVFERVSDIARRVIPHDALSLPLLTDDKNNIVVYAATGYTSRIPETIPLPEHHRALVTSPWDHLIYHDMQDDPLEAISPPGQAGYRARLLVPVRNHGETLGALDFLSMKAGIYTPGDAMVARRIADHVAMALSHHRLAEQARRNEELRAREARLEILDELLSSVTDTGEIKEQFDRISEIAGKVLRHDALVLSVMQPDGVHAKAYAYSGLGPSATPQVVEVPEAILRGDRDYEVIDDLTASTNSFDRDGAALGFRSALRVTIRLDGRLAGGLSFVSQKPAAFTVADVLIARRIAARIALALSRELRAEATTRAQQAQELAGALERRVKSLAAELNAVTGYRWVVGQSEPWTKVLKQATQVAATEATVLLLGESGTGKEVIARFIHRASARSGGPFVALNCAALPEPLLESELFGFERGAFTGATQAKPGQLEQAAGGLLFLDEVGDMTLSVQAKFLRVLQEKEFQRLGGTRTLKANVRIVAATNRNLRAAIERGAFREDLYYRLHVFVIHLPALRDRRDDILPLSEAFLTEIAKGLGRPPAGIAREARNSLLAYDWPGNVRELRNTLERAAILCEGGLITREHLTFVASQPVETHARPVGAYQPPLTDVAATTDLNTLERAAIERALYEARQNKSRAAKMLGLTRKQLYVRLRQHRLD
jgi:two-component system response regulator AtoC